MWKIFEYEGKKVRPSKKIVAPLPQENALRRKRGSVKVVKKEWNTWMYGVFLLGRKFLHLSFLFGNLSDGILLLARETQFEIQNASGVFFLDPRSRCRFLVFI